MEIVVVNDFYHRLHRLTGNGVGHRAPEAVAALHRIAQQRILAFVPEGGQHRCVCNHRLIAHLYGYLAAALVVGHVVLPAAYDRAPVGALDDRTSAVIAIEIGGVDGLAQRGVVLPRVAEPVGIGMRALPRCPCVPRVVHYLGAAMEVDGHDEMPRCDPVDDGLRLGLDVGGSLYTWQVWIVAVELHVIVVVVGGMDVVFQYQAVG